MILRVVGMVESIYPDVAKVEITNPPLERCCSLPGDGISASLQQEFQGEVRFGGATQKMQLVYAK